MNPSRTPFALALERLTSDLATAVLAAVRGATVGEILELDAGAAARAATAPIGRPSAALPARGPVRARGARRAPRVPAGAKVALAQPTPAAEDEDAPADGTAIDAVSMLESLDRQAARLEDPAPAAPRLPEREKPPAESAARIAAPVPALRAGEALLRTPTGGVVLRRRRSADGAA